jgi:hypothetical protein
VLFETCGCRPGFADLVSPRFAILPADFGKLIAADHRKVEQMIGTTRSRVSFFMNKFRKLVGCVSNTAENWKSVTRC